jgi:arabinogalactan oligomer/maltooligosaccharide transport system permease protein
VLNYFAGFFLAVVLNNPRLPERAVYRTLLIVPWALPGTLTILVWQGLMNQTFGPIDTILQNIGLPAVPWLNDPMAARIAILIVNLWLGFPFNMIVCLGGLQAIGGEVFEAAAVDGATSLQRLRLITLPLVFQITMPMLVGAFSFNLMNFGVVYLLTSGNPPRTDTSFAGTTDILPSFVYKLVLNFYRYDKAAAMGIIIFIIAAVISTIGFRMSGAFKEVQA